MKMISDVLEGIALLLKNVDWIRAAAVTAVEIVCVFAIAILIVCFIPHDRNNGKKVHRG